MNDSRKRAEEAIARVAKMKAEKLMTPATQKIQQTANMTLKDLGVDPDYVGATLGLVKGAIDLNQGQLEIPVSKEVEIGITNKPDDKGLRLKFNKKFD